jgi:hypothetical protein
LERIDALLAGVTRDDIQKLPPAHRMRLAQVLRHIASLCAPDTPAPERVVEMLRSLKATDFDDMYPLNRANFAATCRRVAQVADPRRDFHKGGGNNGILSQLPADT